LSKNHAPTMTVSYQFHAVSVRKPRRRADILQASSRAKIMPKNQSQKKNMSSAPVHTSLGCGSTVRSPGTPPDEYSRM